MQQSEYRGEIPQWPQQVPRTPPAERGSGQKFQVSLGRAVKDLKKEIERLDPDDYDVYFGNNHTRTDGFPRHNANPNDPGFVVKWRKDGTAHAIGSDGYKKLVANVREAHLWMKETRMRSDREVSTAGADFAAAELPPPDESGAPEVTVAEAEDLLGVQQTAPDAAIEESFRVQVKDAHGDTSGPSDGRLVQKLKQARDILTDG